MNVHSTVLQNIVGMIQHNLEDKGSYVHFNVNSLSRMHQSVLLLFDNVIRVLCGIFNGFLIDH